METDLIMFACKGITLFDLMEPRTFHFLHRAIILDGRRETEPLHYFYSRLDTWVSFYRNASNITTVFLEAGTPLKVTLSDSILQTKMILLNAGEGNSHGNGYLVDNWPILYRTEYKVARDMWTLLTPRIANLEKRGIFNERIRNLQQAGKKDLNSAESALQMKQYGRFFEATASSWALAARVYDDVEKTQKDVLYGVLFYIALFVPFAFCLERLLFSYSNIYKRIICGPARAPRIRRHLTSCTSAASLHRTPLIPCPRKLCWLLPNTAQSGRLCPPPAVTPTGLSLLSRRLGSGTTGWRKFCKRKAPPLS